MNIAGVMSGTSTTLSLQEKQRENLLRMLDFNAENTDTNDSNRWGDQWKILVYDRMGRDIISPILKLHELRKKGVTLHMLLEAERDAIPDVPAIYFVEPTPNNIQQIITDCTKQLYSTVHLNFLYPLSREMLELLARLSVEASCTSMIAKVYDQYTNFVSMEPSLFSLHLPNSYRAYNDATMTDAAIEQNMNTIVRGLFSVLATTGKVPVIRCPKDHGPARMVAEQLTQMLRDYLSARNGLFHDQTSSFQRPVLIIMDRNVDLCSSLHHPSTYQALVDDMLKITLNRVKVSVKKATSDDPNARVVEKTYDLDITSDAFFEAHAGSLFPDAIDANEEEMKQVTRKEEEIRAKTGGTNVEAMLNGSTKDLVAAVDTLPALIEKKKMLEIHTNIFHAAFELVTARHIPNFSMMEQKLMDGSHVDKQEVIQLLQGPATGTLSDKMRLLMIYYLTTGSTNGEMAELEQAYMSVVSGKAEEQVLQTAWKYLKKHTAFQKNRITDVHGHNTPPSSQSSLNASNSSATGVHLNKFKGLAQGFLAQAAAQVKTFLPENKKLYITRVTDAICELRSQTEDDLFLYLDPKIKSDPQYQTPRQRTPFREAMVFMIGGGNYNEYQNLMAYAKTPMANSQTRTIWYGCTELLSPDEFIQQLGTLN